MRLYDNSLYTDDVLNVGELELPWEKLRNKVLVLSGATGLLGSFLVDVLMKKNAFADLNCKIFALGRSEERFRLRFDKLCDDPNLTFVPYDVKTVLEDGKIEKVDYVLHLASNTHPMQYSTDPIGTITTNIIGLNHMLDYAVNHNASRFAFASSNEIYGENRGDVELFLEDYCGYINPNTMRAGYPESKRCGESLCQAYRKQKSLDVVIPRFTRSYGPTMLQSDTKAISQFINNAIKREDIVLKSLGNQYYSYTYVADAISGLLYILLCGKNGEAYNIADEASDITLKDLARTIADTTGTKVVFDTPDSIEAAGYSTATKARLDGHKLKNLGWKPRYDIKSGIERTIVILDSITN